MKRLIPRLTITRVAVWSVIAALLVVASPWIKGLMVICIATTGPRSASCLIWFLDSDPFTSGAATSYLTDFGDEAIAPLCECLTDGARGELVRARCANCLRRIGKNNDSVLKALRIGAADSSELVRAHSLRALWKLANNHETVRQLAALLDSDDPHVLDITMMALDEIGRPAHSVGPKLRALLQRMPKMESQIRMTLTSIWADPD